MEGSYLIYFVNFSVRFGLSTPTYDDFILIEFLYLVGLFFSITNMTLSFLLFFIQNQKFRLTLKALITSTFCNFKQKQLPKRTNDVAVNNSNANLGTFSTCLDDLRHTWLFDIQHSTWTWFLWSRVKITPLNPDYPQTDVRVGGGSGGCNCLWGIKTFKIRRVMGVMGGGDF